MADIPFPRGVRDLLPNEALFRNEVLKKIEEIFQRFGFLTIDTPTFESIKVLNAKGGIGEDTKLIYEMKEEDVALRYDLTVSLARYVAMNQSLPQPFKRYAIGKAWRREEPQKLRYREFTQADADIIGGRVAATDAEVIAVCANVLGSLGIEYTVQINNRKFLDDLFETIGISKDLFMPVLRAIDKLDKIGRDGVTEMLQKLNLSRDVVSKIDTLINFDGTNEDKLAYLEKTLKNKQPITELRETLEILELYKLREGSLNINFSLVRGFDYYTGIVFEYKLADTSIKSSIGGGGRYDNLIGVFGGKSMPAVGSSLGIDRLLDVLNFSSSIKQTYATVFIATINDKNYNYALQVANLFRAQGIGVDVNMASRNISNQLAYANALNFKYAIVIGDMEEKKNELKIRNLIDGSESTTSINDALEILKNNK
jgi:histidyl-tRNA synthetase